MRAEAHLAEIVSAMEKTEIFCRLAVPARSHHLGESYLLAFPDSSGSNLLHNFYDVDVQSWLHATSFARHLLHAPRLFLHLAIESTAIGPIGLPLVVPLAGH
jgi:hypothetical protein